MIKHCLICEGEGKYKCPKCQTFNCSLPCFKAHKSEGKCDEIQAAEEPRKEIVEDRRPSRIAVFTTLDTVSPEKLEKLGESEVIKNLLRNSHLRNFLQEINKAPNAWNAMKLAMTEPIFLEFADECSKVIEGNDKEVEDFH